MGRDVRRSHSRASRSCSSVMIAQRRRIFSRQASCPARIARIALFAAAVMPLPPRLGTQLVNQSQPMPCVSKKIAAFFPLAQKKAKTRIGNATQGATQSGYLTDAGEPVDPLSTWKIWGE